MSSLVDPDRLLRRASELGVSEWSDVDVVRYVAERVRVPRRDPADSFVLHAPLEVLARAALLPWVAPAGTDRARLRLLALLAQYEDADPAPRTAPTRTTDPEMATLDLVAALATGDLERADGAAGALAATHDPTVWARHVGSPVLPHLGAAAHAPIFLYHLPRVAPRGEATGELARPLVRELARYPELQLAWVHERDRAATTGSPGALAAALAAVPHLGIPGSTFIHPLMHQVDERVAPELVGPTAAGLAPEVAAAVLLRHAARAMLTSDPAHAPYGWSHCLTMPHAALGIARVTGDPQLAVDVAATYVVGFLAALATEPVPDRVQLANPGGTFVDALAAGKDAAAGFVLHAPPKTRAALWTEMITRACGRRDAHLVKYTHACLDLATTDAPAAPLYQAAAAALLAIWEPVVDPEDPLPRGVATA